MTATEDWIANYAPEHEAELRPLLRHSWKPDLRTGSAMKSHLGGLPLLDSPSSWPRCPDCRTFMRLLLQLDPRELPTKARSCFDFGDRVIQLFACLRDPLECPGLSQWSYLDPNAPQAVVVRNERLTAPIATCPADDFTPMVSVGISGWRENHDLPHPSEAAAMGAPKIIVDRLEDLGLTATGDKLGGWANWYNSFEPIPCPICHRSMWLFFQFESSSMGGSLEHDFGDSGSASLHTCPSDRAFHFAWSGL